MANSKSKINLGEIIISFFASKALERAGQSAGEFLSLHKNCNWGEVTAEEKTQNDENVKNKEGKILSAYVTTFNEFLWVTTDLSKEETIVLLPREFDLLPEG